MTSAHVEGPYDVALVEGSITTPEDAARILEVRASSRTLITIGACASAGGIQGLRNFAPPGSYPPVVYAHPEYLSSLDTSTPIADHVAVDVELHGCPIDRYQLLEVILAALAGRRPLIPTYSVCRECKARGNVCVVVANGEPCLGPVTQRGLRRRSVRRSGAAASAASARARRPRSRRWSRAPRGTRAAPRRAGASPAHVQRRRAGVRDAWLTPTSPGGRAVSHGTRRPSRSRASPGSRARARCASRCATAR